MKYVVVLGDGMADEPIEELGGKTPLEYADTPVMDEMAEKSEIGMVKTVPDGMHPGSDIANLAVMGYDPEKYYTGRSPLEALSIGVDMKPTDVAIRCNLVTLSDDDNPYEEKTILDHSASEISTQDAKVLLDAVKKEFENDTYKFYLGTSYRHLVIWKDGSVTDLTAPHDVLGQKIGSYLPKDDALCYMQKKSYEILKNHPINIERVKEGKNPANSIWFWGAGTRPCLDSFEEKNHKKGVMISAVDLLKGIAVGADMKVIEVEGATGGLETNYEGNADAAIRALLDDGYDFAYIHLEAPDEMGHQGSVPKKVKAIEYIDARILKPVWEALDKSEEDYRIMVLPDHPTPICIRTHTSNPIPFMIYDSRDSKNLGLSYTEKSAAESDLFIEKGYELMPRLFSK